MIGEMVVFSDVQRDVVVVDGILYEPIPARIAVAQVGLAEEFAVGNVDQFAWSRNADFHAVYFIAPLILVRPPHARAQLLACGVDPSPARRVLFEGDAAESSRFRWTA